MNENDEKFQRRALIIVAIMFLFGLILILKLFFIQVKSEHKYQEKIIKQSMRKIRVPAQRGKIYTSDLKIVADTVPEVNLVLYLNEIRQSSRRKTIEYIERSAAEMAARLHRDYPLTEAKITRHIRQTPGLPLVVFKELDQSEIALANSLVSELEGWALEVDSHREYPYKDFAAHLIGYVRKDDASKASDRLNFSYYITDYVGIYGLEKSFDRIEGGEGAPLRGLRGYPGYSLVQVDNLGYVRKSIIDEIPPKHGNHVVLNLDFNAQMTAESMLAGQNGAMVLLDADNGKVLAMASAPAFNLDQFSPKLGGEYYKSLLNDENKPLLNKALNGTFSPGSIAKVVVAMAILESGVSPEDTVFCDGATKIGNSLIRCAAYRYGGHGNVNLIKALEKSCNDYFIEKGLKLGREAIYESFVSAHLGIDPGLELKSSLGVLPTVENKRKNFREPWRDFDTGLISIGQGIISVTPLQAAVYTAAICNGGNLMEPQLLDRIVDQEGNVLLQKTPKVTGRLKVSPDNLAYIRQGMFEVVNSSGGSGKLAKVEGLNIYGKTGTAEIGSKEKRRQNTWFIAFVTYNERNYAVSLIIEDGKSGGSSCAPLVAEFFRRYFRLAN